MKTNEIVIGRAFSKACRACYERMMAQIRTARETILVEARKTAEVHEGFLRLAVNEAEALAWQTMYPQLMFPALAAEKIQRVVHWSRRQRRVAAPLARL